ncbi:PilZ domain-containing protein [bacterium]|nr:PilZ domain-containing protein [bacterium]
MVEDTLKLGVGIELLMKVDSLTENIRKIGVIHGWMGQELIIVKVPDDTNIQHYSTSTPLLVGFVNQGITYGFKSKLVMRLKILNHNIFVIEYPRESKKVNLRTNERLKVEIKGNLRLIQEGMSLDDSPIIDFVIIDLSSGGCGLVTKFELKKGDKMLLNFLLPPDSVITNLPGLVVNVHSQVSSEYSFGVKFYPKEEHMESISRHLSIVNEIKIMAGIKDFG